MTPSTRPPLRGEIWFVNLPTDPPDKSARPVIVVSLDERNRHPRAATVLVVPLTTTLRESVTHIRLPPGETGLSEMSAAMAEDISVVRRISLIPSRYPLRRLSNTRICEIAARVTLAMGCSNFGQ